MYTLVTVEVDVGLVPVSDLFRESDGPLRCARSCQCTRGELCDPGIFGIDGDPAMLVSTEWCEAVGVSKLSDDSYS